MSSKPLKVIISDETHQGEQYSGHLWSKKFGGWKISLDSCWIFKMHFFPLFSPKPEFWGTWFWLVTDGIHIQLQSITSAKEITYQLINRKKIVTASGYFGETEMETETEKTKKEISIDTNSKERKLTKVTFTNPHSKCDTLWLSIDWLFVVRLFWHKKCWRLKVHGPLFVKRIQLQEQKRPIPSST